MHRYLTPEDLFGASARLDGPLNWLRDADRETVLRETAYWLSRFDNTDLDGWKVIERDWVSKQIAEPHRTRLLSQMHGNVTLVSSQALLMVAKRTILSGKPSELTDTRPLFMAAVAIQGTLGAQDESDPAATRRRLLAELVRNQAFNRRPDGGMRVVQAHLRWRDIPRRTRPPSVSDPCRTVADTMAEYVSCAVRRRRRQSRRGCRSRCFRRSSEPAEVLGRGVRRRR